MPRVHVPHPPPLAADLAIRALGLLLTLWGIWGIFWVVVASGGAERWSTTDTVLFGLLHLVVLITGVVVLRSRPRT